MLFQRNSPRFKNAEYMYICSTRLLTAKEMAVLLCLELHI